MQDRMERIEKELERIADQLRRIDSRLSRVEEERHGASSLPEPEPREPAAAGTPPTTTVTEPRTVVHVLGLLGRTFLVLCGAFLLRSLTDAELLPLSLGVALGLAYAAVWLVAADRSAGANRSLSAILSGFAFTVIAYPLLWEATTRFSLLSAAAATVTLAIFTTLALIVAWRRNIEVVAWVVMAAALVTDLAIMLTFRNWGIGAMAALLLGGAAVWFAYTREWNALPWPVAAVVNVVPLMVISAALGTGKPGVPEGPSVALTLALLAVFLATYLGSFSVRTLYQGRDLGAFEVAQTAVCLAIGLTGSVAVTRNAGLDTGLLGWVAVVAGAICYLVGFTFVDRRLGRGRTFLYYTSVALILMIWGLFLIAQSGVLVAALCGLAVVAALLGGRFDRVTLRAHSAVFVTTATIAAGMVERAVEALVLPVAEVQPSLDGPDLVVVGSATVCFAVIVATHSTVGVRWPARIPRFVLAALSAVGLATVALNLVIHAFGRTAVVDPAVIAAARTAILSLSAIVLAALGSRQRLVELTWLVYPLLVVTGAKLLLEDLRQGRPLTLFISFAFFGIALIVAPRLLRRPGSPAVADGESG
jgi:hypothetical protein